MEQHNNPQPLRKSSTMTSEDKDLLFASWVDVNADTRGDSRISREYQEAHIANLGIPALSQPFEPDSQHQLGFEQTTAIANDENSTHGNHFLPAHPVMHNPSHNFDTLSPNGAPTVRSSTSTTSLFSQNAQPQLSGMASEYLTPNSYQGESFQRIRSNSHSAYSVSSNDHSTANSPYISAHSPSPELYRSSDSVFVEDVNNLGSQMLTAFSLGPEMSPGSHGTMPEHAIPPVDFPLFDGPPPAEGVVYRGAPGPITISIEAPRGEPPVEQFNSQVQVQAQAHPQAQPIPIISTEGVHSQSYLTPSDSQSYISAQGSPGLSHSSSPRLDLASIHSSPGISGISGISPGISPGIPTIPSPDSELLRPFASGSDVDSVASSPGDARARSRTRDRSDSTVSSTRSRSNSGSRSRSRSRSREPGSREYYLDLASVGGPNKRMQKHPSTHHCTLCDKSFTRAYNLRSHLRTHTDERPFRCSFCDKAFARQHDRKRHEDLHRGERKYQCKGKLKDGSTWGCGKRFARTDALARHFRTDAGARCIKPLRDEVEQEKREMEMEMEMSQSAGYGGVGLAVGAGGVGGVGGVSDAGGAGGAGNAGETGVRPALRHRTTADFFNSLMGDAALPEEFYRQFTVED